jgi:hypothetical protein
MVQQNTTAFVKLLKTRSERVRMTSVYGWHLDSNRCVNASFSNATPT